MSPRRRIEPGGDPTVAETMSKKRRDWKLPMVAGTTALLIAGSIAISTLVLISHETQRHTAVNGVAVIDFVRSFMTQYTSLDPFHANDYADRVLDMGTGGFAQQYRDNMNEIVLQVARAEPTHGAVLDAGVERWNRDGSADVVIVVEVVTPLPDGGAADSRSRWVATVQREGDQWKVGNLLQVI